MNVDNVILVLGAVVSVLLSVIAVLKSFSLGNRQEVDISRVWHHVDEKTNGMWEQFGRQMDGRMVEAERRLVRQMMERMGRELGDIRHALKNPPQEE